MVSSENMLSVVHFWYYNANRSSLLEKALKAVGGDIFRKVWEKPHDGSLMYTVLPHSIFIACKNPIIDMGPKVQILRLHLNL